MARPREFDYEQALHLAMDAFWAKGYRSTSLEDLLKAMAIGKGSFYEAFGDKRQLFISALEAYTKLTTQRMLRQLHGDRPFLDKLDGIFDKIIETALTGNDRRGCMIANSAIELSPHDDEIERLVATELRRIENAYWRAIAHAQKNGEIAKDKNARALARFVVCNLNGLVVISKAMPDRSTLVDIKRVVISTFR